MRTTPATQLDAVLALARLRSFRAAATELGTSTSALSHTIAALEARLGVRLFNRTTRSVALSDAGEQFVADITPAVAAIRDAMEKAGNRRRTPTGSLRLNTHASAARHIMEPIILEYRRRYPEVNIDLVTEGRLVDIVAGGFDAGIRLAEAIPKDMVAVPLGPKLRMAVVGTPSYFAAHPAPRTPADLAAHECIRIRLPSGGLYSWEFERRGAAVAVDVKGALTLDDADLMLAAARAGTGLAYLTEWYVSADLAEGRLQQVLEAWTPYFPGLCLYYPSRRHVPASLRALLNLIEEVRRT
jgi:DNA-binding transcriptional LysR family regulator